MYIDGAIVGHENCLLLGSRIYDAMIDMMLPMPPAPPQPT